MYDRRWHLTHCPIGILSLVSIVSLVAPGCSHAPKQDAPTRSEIVNRNDASRFAYGVGYTLGRDVRAGLEADGLSPDVALVTDGFEDAMSDRSPDMPKAELDRVLRAVHRVLLERSAKQAYDTDPEFRALADANAARSAAAVALFASQPGTRMVSEGVYETIIATGSGRTPGAGEVYVADWKVTRSDGSVVDDRKASAVDPDNLLPHAGAVLRSMRVGDARRIAFAPAQAFGLGGDAPAVGPNEAIFVEIRIIDVAARGGAQ